MTSPADHCPACGQVPLVSKVPAASRGFWPSIVRVVVLEAVLLLVLAGVVVFYLNWSSEVAFAEFLAASKTPVTPSSPLSAVKTQPCERGA